MGNKSSRSRGHDERQSAADGRKRSLFSAKTPSDAPLAQGKEASLQRGAHGALCLYLCHLAMHIQSKLFEGANGRL